MRVISNDEVFDDLGILRRSLFPMRIPVPPPMEPSVDCIHDEITVRSHLIVALFSSMILTSTDEYRLGENVGCI